MYDINIITLIVIGILIWEGIKWGFKKIKFNQWNQRRKQRQWNKKHDNGSYIGLKLKRKDQPWFRG